MRRPAKLLSNYRIVHVTFGQIQNERRKFSSVYDRPITQDGSNPVLHLFDFNKKANLGMSDGLPDPQAIVTERGQDICFAYAIPASSSPSRLYAPSLLWLLPGLASHTAIKRLSVVPRSGGENYAGRPGAECQTPTDLFIPDETLSTDNVTCRVSEQPQISLEQPIRLQRYQFSGYGGKTLIIRRNECIPCYIKVILKDGDKLRREKS